MIQRIRFFVTAGCLAALLVAIPAHAQDVGIKGGANFSRFVLDPEDPDTEFKRLTGPTGGVFVVGGRGAMAVQVEALYSVRGTKATVGGVDEQFEITYLDVPLLLRFNGAPSNGSVFYAVFGPTLGFRLKVEDKNDPDADLEDEVEKRDLGLTFGLGVESGHIVLDARYLYGLRNIDASGGMDELKHRTFSVTLGFVF
jgi:hypothetical protein